MKHIWRLSITALCVLAFTADTAPAQRVGASGNTGAVTDVGLDIQKIQIEQALRRNGLEISGLNPRPSMDIALFGPSWLQKMEQYQRTFNPGDSRRIIEQDLTRARSDCAAGRGDRCRTVLAYTEVLRTLDPGDGICGAAQRAYAEYYGGTSAPDAIARKFDLACLGSTLKRSDGDRIVDADPLPDVFQRGALSSVGLLVLDGKPYCAGLLLNDHRFITAAHCFSSIPQASAQAGKLLIQPASGSRGPWKVAPVPVDRGDAASNLVMDDYAVLHIDTSDPIGAADIELAAASRFGEVSVLASFSDYRKSGYPTLGANPDWRASLRFPKTGYCQATGRKSLCLFLLCQTIHGFSGAPVFQAGQNGKVQVIGFISGPEAAPGSGCGNGFANATVARSAHDILGKAL